MSKTLQTIVQGYLYAGLSAAAALYLTGVTDLKTLGTAALTAIVGPVLQAINPKDAAIGVGRSE